MQLNKEKSEFLNEMIDNWQSQELISKEQSKQLKQSYTIRKFDWKQVTVYAFVIAVICGVLSVIVLLADKPLRALIERFTQITDLGISGILTVFTLLIFWYTQKRFREHPATPFSNNSFLLFGAFLSLASLSYWAKTFHVFHDNYSFIFLAAAMLYMVLAIYFGSQTIWVVGILMFGFAYGSFTVFLTQNDTKFLGMNFPVRFIPFSLIVLAFLLIIKRKEKLQLFFNVHYITGLLLFYIALWLVTVFGNYTSFEEWDAVKQWNFIFWDVVLFAIALAGMYIGLKRNDHILGNISLTFFILNLLTRYFEYFWEPLHKSIFFMILAFIFWFIGSRAERLWNLKFLEEK